MKITRSLLQSLTFRPFTRTDYYGFSGVESPIPMIAETPEFTVVIDGDYAELYLSGDDLDGAADQCDSIRALPYKTEKQLKIEAEIEAMEIALENLKSQLNS